MRTDNYKVSAHKFYLSEDILQKLQLRLPTLYFNRYKIR